jgi:group I intron endonuclease
VARSVIPPKKRAAAIADLLAGDQPAIVAERYGIDAAKGFNALVCGMWYNRTGVQKPTRVRLTRRGNGCKLIRSCNMPSISRTPSIYQIRHIESGKVYVGSAVNPYRRYQEHRNALVKGVHYSPYLQRAWDKYGESAFVFEIIEPVLFVEDLTAREQHWIDVLRACDKLHGFNVAPTAGSVLGTKYTEERRAKASARATAQFADPTARAKLSANARARYADPTERQRQSETRKAYLAEPSIREWIAKKMKALWADPAYRAQRKKTRDERKKKS